MKKKLTLRNIIIAQIVLLLLVIVLGFVLRADPYGGPRSVHKLVGMLSAVVALTSAVLLMKQKLTINQKALAWVPFTLVVFAAISGNLLGEVDAYEMMFNMMLMSGFLAFISSIIIFVMISKIKRSKKSTEDTPAK